MKDMGAGEGVVVNLQEIPENGRDLGNREDTTSCHELLDIGRNGGIGRGCRDLPLAASRWRKCGEGIGCRELT